jgi:hypothetical protein
MRFQIRCFARCKDFGAVLPQRRTSCNAKSPQRFRTGENEAVEATEDQVSIRPDLDHIGYDVGLAGRTHLRDSGRIGCCSPAVNSAARLARTGAGCDAIGASV